MKYPPCPFPPAFIHFVHLWKLIKPYYSLITTYNAHFCTVIYYHSSVNSHSHHHNKVDMIIIFLVSSSPNELLPYLLLFYTKHTTDAFEGSRIKVGNPLNPYSTLHKNNTGTWSQLFCLLVSLPQVRSIT